jgi:hypothetical protein
LPQLIQLLGARVKIGIQLHSGTFLSPKFSLPDRDCVLQLLDETHRKTD